MILKWPFDHTSFPATERAKSPHCDSQAEADHGLGWTLNHMGGWDSKVGKEKYRKIVKISKEYSQRNFCHYCSSLSNLVLEDWLLILHHVVHSWSLCCVDMLRMLVFLLRHSVSGDRKRGSLFGFQHGYRKLFFISKELTSKNNYRRTMVQQITYYTTVYNPITN